MVEPDNHENHSYYLVEETEFKWADYMLEDVYVDEIDIEINGLYKELDEKLMKVYKYYEEKIQKLKLTRSLPKTYAECRQLMDDKGTNDVVSGYKYNEVGKLQELIRCRDFYRNIYQREWKPDWNNGNQIKYVIQFEHDELVLNHTRYDHYVFSFPNEYLRDEFAKNFEEDLLMLKFL